MPVLQQTFERDGVEIQSFTLVSGTASVSVINYGATMTHFTTRTAAGVDRDVLLGFDDPFGNIDAATAQNYFFGSFVGRSCNRTAGGTFTLNGTEYSLPVNNGPNSLHGGTRGFDKRFFTPRIDSHSPPTVSFSLVSDHLDQGYPGTVRVEASYCLVESTLVITTNAQLIDDVVKETYVNLTQHPYFNLSVSPSVEGHEIVMTGVSGSLELDENQIGTGAILTALTNPELFFPPMKDLKSALPAVQQFRGYDHFYLVNTDKTSLVVRDPVSKLRLEVATDCAGFQLYTAGWLDGSLKAKKVHGYESYGQYAGFAIEPSAPPNAINMPQYKHLVILTKEKPLESRISFKLVAE